MTSQGSQGELGYYNTQQSFPFASLDDRQFKSLFSSSSRELDTDLDLYNILPNPDKFDESDPDHMLTNVVSDYCSIDKINNILNVAGPKAISFFHCNVRSLPKNHTLLTDLIYSIQVKPDILAISETKLNENNVVNVDITGYNFFHTDSSTNAGGAAIYVNRDIKAIARPDIKLPLDDVESCWIEIESGFNDNKNIIVGCVYRHPKSKICEFIERLDALLKYLNQCKYQVVLLGDINIDFLRYITHQMTDKYLDMLYTNNFLPIITKPTRITDHTKTLIDHIYTNMAIDQVKSGIAIFDISDHLPVFTVIKTSCNRIQDTLYYRDYRTFKQEDFLSELTQINWDENLRHLNNNIHQSTKNIINHIERVTQRHAPMKEVSQSKLKQLNKPWITNGILKSIKVKQRMYRTHFYSNDTSKVTQYKR